MLDLDLRAQKHLHRETELAVAPGATQLFEKPGTLDDAGLPTQRLVPPLPRAHVGVPGPSPRAGVDLGLCSTEVGATRLEG